MSAATQKKSGFTAHKIFYMAIALLLFSAIVSILFTANADGNRVAQYVRGRFQDKGEVQNGTLEMEGIDAIGEIPEGEIRYYINKEMVFPNGYARGDVLLQNPQQSAYVLQFRFYLADGSSNVPVYTSAQLAPGQFLDGDKLDRYLYAGNYDCTYTVTAYDPADRTIECGSVSGFVKLTVVS